MIVHPDDGAFKLIRAGGWRIAQGYEVAARNIDFIGEGQRDRLAGNCDGEITVRRDDTRDGAAAAGGQHADRVARADATARNRTGIAAEIEMRAIDPLHRKPKRHLLHARVV